MWENKKDAEKKDAILEYCIEFVIKKGYNTFYSYNLAEILFGSSINYESQAVRLIKDIGSFNKDLVYNIKGTDSISFECNAHLAEQFLENGGFKAIELEQERKDKEAKNEKLEYNELQKLYKENLELNNKLLKESKFVAIKWSVITALAIFGVEKLFSFLYCHYFNK